MADTTLAAIIASIFQVIGILVFIFGGIIFGIGFASQNEMLEGGWSSRKRQGLIMVVAGGMILALNSVGKIVFSTLEAQCVSFPFVGQWAPALGLALMTYGVTQIALHFISDSFGDRIWGIRFIIGGAMISQVGPIIDFILKGLT